MSKNFQINLADLYLILKVRQAFFCLIIGIYVIFDLNYVKLWNIFTLQEIDW